MKKYYWNLMVIILPSLILLSCSNDEFKDIPYLETQAKLDNDSIRIVSSLDELFDAFDLTPSEEIPVLELRKTMDIQNKTALGYTSISESGVQKLSFAADLAKQLGLSPAVGYHCYYKTVTKNITVSVPWNFYNDTSPLCGYRPKTNGSFTYTERGYSVGSNTSQITLTTYLLYVDYDMRGNYVRKHYPCSPEQIQWAYLLI